MKALLMSAAAAAILLTSQGAALAGDPITGNWVRNSGPMLNVEPCGPRYCVTFASGQDAGETAGTIKMNGDGTYATLVEDFESGKPVSGTAALAEDVLNVTLGAGNEPETWRRH